MPYNKFKIEHIKSVLGVKMSKNAWINTMNLPEFGRDEILELLLQESETFYLGTEKARSEFMVTPILQSLSRKNKNKFSIFSGYEFNIDKERNLTGFCDYILSSVTDSLILESPTFLVVETKRREIDDDALAQCGAEMYAAKLFNEREGSISTKMYGCATSGFSWAFLKLENDVLSVDPNYVPLTFHNPYDVLSVLQYVVNQSLK